MARAEDIERLIDIDQPSEPIESQEKKGGDGSDFMQQFRERARQAYDYWQYDFTNASEDVDFIYREDGQWPQHVLSERKDRPVLTINLLQQYLNQLVGTARQNKFSIRVLQKSGTRNPVGMLGTSEVISPSEAIEGIIRDIEQRSMAPTAYSRALQHAVEGGFGWLRVRTFRPPDDPMNMEMRIEHIEDRWGVLMDPYCSMFDYSDAEYCMITHSMTKEAFEARWPGKEAVTSVGTWGAEQTRFQEYWSGERQVKVCEYYYKEPAKRTAAQYLDPEGMSAFTVYMDEMEDIEDEIEDQGFHKIEEKEVDSYFMKMCVCTAHEVLETPVTWPGMQIPVVPVFGRTVDYEDRKEHHGAFHHAKDAARMHNYWMSVATEKMADAPRAPWIATAEQLAGYEPMWEKQHLIRQNVLPYNHVEGQPPPTRLAPPPFPIGEINLAMQARASVQDTVGMHEADVGAKGNEKSGRAIAERRYAGERGTFEFTDNLAHSISRIGQILCEIIPPVYSSAALQRIVMPDETSALIELNKEIVDEETGMKFRFGSINLGRYYATVTASPHNATQRTLFLEIITELGKTNPQGMMPFLDLIFDAADPPNKSEIVRRARMAMPRQFLRPEDQQKLPQPQPSPDAIAMQAEAEADQAKAQATQVQAQANTEIAQLRVEEQKLKLEEAKAGALKADAEAAAGGEGEGGGEDDSAKIEAIVKREIAKALAKRSR